MKEKTKIKASDTEKIKERITIFVIFILLSDLIFLYLSKYSRKNLSILEFNPYNIGNILNFASVIIPVTGLLILLFNNKVSDKKYYTFLVITIIMNVLLVLTVLFKQIKFPMPAGYLFGFPFERVYITVFYSGFQFLLITLGVFIWLIIFKAQGFVYIFALLYSAIIVFLLTAWAFIYTSNDIGENPVSIKDGKKYDAAVVLGAAVWSRNKASPIFASRIGKACNLYNAGIIKKIQVTGGNAPGELTEADVASKLLISYGVDKKDIWIEQKTSSTSEQIEFIKENLAKKQNLKRILIVSDHFHLKRVMEICDFFNLKAEPMASDLMLSWEKSLMYQLRDSVALLFFWFFAL
ncbi:MAG: YdcF family protein [Ignavibacteria bacterium]